MMSTAEFVTIGDYERLKRRCQWYQDALEAIVRRVDGWSGDNRGGLAVQRKRWKIVGQIAREALGELNA